MSSKIEWTDETWNPVTGCTKVSAGCANCYAERMAKRFHDGGGDHFSVRCHSDRLDKPLHWRKSRKVFVCSMGDLFHDDVPHEFLLDVFSTIIKARSHVFQILTKRPERMCEFMSKIEHHAGLQPHVWLGVSAEDQRTADERIPLLLKTPAAVRFVSVEPMLGAVDLRNIKWAKLNVPGLHDAWSLNNALTKRPADDLNMEKTGLDWVICGGESGPGARPMHPDLVRSLRDQCAESGVPFLFKQWGNNPDVSAFYEPRGLINARLDQPKYGRVLDGVIHDEYPRRGL